MSISLLHGLKQTEVSQCFYSDHQLVWAELSNNETICKGPGLWVMNNSILKDNVYQTIISEFWENWKLQKGNLINLSMWWDESEINGIRLPDGLISKCGGARGACAPPLF